MDTPLYDSAGHALMGEIVVGVLHASTPLYDALCVEKGFNPLARHEAAAEATRRVVREAFLIDLELRAQRTRMA